MNSLLKLTASLMALAITLAAIPTVTKSQSNSQTHWSDNYTTTLINYHVLPPHTIFIHPDAPISRILLEAHLNRLHGRTVSTHNTHPPEVYVSRLEAVLLIAQSFRLPSADKSILHPFADYNLIPELYQPMFAALVYAGIINGHCSGLLDPFGQITNAQASALLLRTTGTIFSQQGNFTNREITTNALINTAGVTLSNVAVGGQLFITEGAYSGSASLSNVSAKKLLVKGAGKLYLSNNDIDIVNLHIARGDTSIISHSTLPMLYISKGHIIYLNGQFTNIIVSAQNINIIATENTSIENLTVTAASENFNLIIDGKVENLLIEGTYGKITGCGNVYNYTILGYNTIFNMLPCLVEEDVTTVAITTMPTQPHISATTTPTLRPPAYDPTEPTPPTTTPQIPTEPPTEHPTQPPTYPTGYITLDTYGNLTFIDDLGQQIVIRPNETLPKPNGHLQALLALLAPNDKIVTQDGIIKEIFISNPRVLSLITDFPPAHPVNLHLGNGSSLILTDISANHSNLTIVGTNNNNIYIYDFTNPAYFSVGGSLNLNAQNFNTAINLGIMNGSDIELAFPEHGSTVQIIPATDTQYARITVRDVTLKLLDDIDYTIHLSSATFQSHLLRVTLRHHTAPQEAFNITNISDTVVPTIEFRRYCATLIGIYAPAPPSVTFPGASMHITNIISEEIEFEHCAKDPFCETMAYETPPYSTLDNYYKREHNTQNPRYD